MWNASVPKDNLPNGTPKAFTKQKFCSVYNFVTSLQHVAIEPFNESLMLNELFQNFLSQTEDYCIKKSSLSGTCVALLKFRTVEYGDAAFMSIKESLEDDTVRVYHPKLEEEDVSKTLDRIHLDTDFIMDSLHGEADPLADRAVILENVPQCDQDELFNEFTSALNIVEFTCDDTVNDVAVLEMRSKQLAEELVKEKNGSSYKEKTICASLLRNRLTTLSDKYIAYARKKETVHSFLNDNERLEKVQEVMALDEEKEELESKMDLIGLQKYYRYKEIMKTHDELRKSLFMDARRRHEKNLKMPEEELPLTETQRRILSGKGIFAKKPQTNGEAKTATSGGPVKRTAPLSDSAPPAKKFTPATAVPSLARGRGTRRGMVAQTQEELFIQALSQRVQELTEEVKAAGKDPTIKPKLNCIHGLGLKAAPEKSSENPVIKAMKNRIMELQVMLGGTSAVEQVVSQIKMRLEATPLLDMPVGRGGPAPVPLMQANITNEFGGSTGRGLLGDYGSSRPGRGMGSGMGSFGAPRPRGGGAYRPSMGDDDMEDVGATIGQLRAKLVELDNKLGTDGGRVRGQMRGRPGNMGLSGRPGRGGSGPSMRMPSAPSMQSSRGMPRGMAIGHNPRARGTRGGRPGIGLGQRGGMY